VDDEAKRSAERALWRIKQGEPFEKVAAEVSSAPSKANGGLIGPIGLNELTPQVQEWLKPLKVGEVTSVQRTTKGYQFLKLETKTPDVIMSLDQARDKIAEKVFNEKRQVEFEKYIKKLRAEAIIEWKNPDLKKVYEERLVSKPVSAQPGL
jgi:parvulin-like peptidyl-prolyl isomerase